MVRMSEVIRDSLQDFKSRNGIRDDKGLAEALGVSAGTISRWTNPRSASRTRSVSTKIWRGVVEKLGLTERDFEPAVMVGGNQLDRIQCEANEPSSKARLAQACHVSDSTVERWCSADAFIIIRRDVWGRIADHLGLDRNDCYQCSLDEAADLEEKAREPERTGKEMPSPTAQPLPSKVLLQSPAEYQEMIERSLDATVLGRARIVKGIRGLGQTTSGLIATQDPVNDGDLVMVQHGQDVVAGKLYRIAVIVVEDEERPQASK